MADGLNVGQRREESRPALRFFSPSHGKEGVTITEEGCGRPVSEGEISPMVDRLGETCQRVGKGGGEWGFGSQKKKLFQEAERTQKYQMQPKRS